MEWLYSVENDEELWQWGSSNVPYSRYTLKTYIAESRHDIYADGQLRLVIETEDEHLVLGCVDLMDFSPRHLRAEIGILLFPEYRGRGVANQGIGDACFLCSRTFVYAPALCYSFPKRI